MEFRSHERERVQPDLGRRTSRRGDGDVHSGVGGTCWADGSDRIGRVDGVARGVHGTKLHRRGAGEVGSVDRHRGAARGGAGGGAEACYTRRRGGRDVDATRRRRQGVAGGGEDVARADHVDGQAGEGGHAVDGGHGHGAAEHGAAGPAGQSERHLAGVGRVGVARAVLGVDGEAEGGVRGHAGGGRRDHELGGGAGVWGVERERVQPDLGRRTSRRGDGDVHSGVGGTCWADGSDRIGRVDGVARGVHGTKLHRRGAGEVGSVDRHRGAARGGAGGGAEACYTRRRGGRDVDATRRRRQGVAGGGEDVARAGRVDGQGGEGGHAVGGGAGHGAAEHGAAGPAGQGERHRAGVGRGGVARAVLGGDGEAEGGVRGDAGGGRRDHELGGGDGGRGDGNATRRRRQGAA